MKMKPSRYSRSDFEAAEGSMNRDFMKQKKTNSTALP